MTRAAVPAGTGRQRPDQIHLGEDIDEIARPHRARLHEIPVLVARKARAHEHVEDVMDVALGLAERDLHPLGERARQVRMAAMVIVGAGEQPVCVRVAACADHIVDARPIGVEAVPIQSVRGNGGHRPQIGQRAPQPISGRQVSSVQRPRLAAEEMLGQIAGVPQIKVAYLRTLDAGDAKKMRRRDIESARFPRRNDRLADLGRGCAGAPVKVRLVSGQPVDGIDDNRRPGSALGRVQRRLMLRRTSHGAER